MAEVKVTKVGNVAPGTGAVVDVDGKAVAVFNVGGTFYATANACTHMGGPLGEGSLEGTTVTCPWHGSQFDVTSGALVRGPARRPVATYKVRVQGDDVFVTTDETSA